MLVHVAQLGFPASERKKPRCVAGLASPSSKYPVRNQGLRPGWGGGGWAGGHTIRDWPTQRFEAGYGSRAKRAGRRGSWQRALMVIPRGALLRYREWYGAAGPNVGLKIPRCSL
jgi:hypothetical protein